ncbi:MAG: zinc dependent phospholipase C family protein [Chloroflexota bacterium]
MPSQLIHLELCADAAARAGWTLDGASGEFLLGAIAPDAWAVSGATRAATHFWDTTNDLSGAVRLREAHPQLANPAALEPRVRALLAGYLCHLVTDEQWTFTVYRPYFGRHSPYRASPEGSRVQWALQAQLEQRIRDQRTTDLRRWLAALASAKGDIDLPFLPARAAAAWRALLLEACQLPTMADAFFRLLSRTGRQGDPAMAQALRAEWPALTGQAAELVPDGALQTFRARAATACDVVLAEWSRATPRPADGREQVGETHVRP